MTPSGFVATVMTVILGLVFLMGACCMLNVQTPIAFPAKSIDWGKVEEHEWFGPYSRDKEKSALILLLSVQKQIEILFFYKALNKDQA